MPPTNLFVRQPNYGDKKHLTLQRLKNLHIGGLSRVALHTLMNTVRGEMAPRLQRNSNVPFLPNPLWCKLVSPEFALAFSSFFQFCFRQSNWQYLYAQ